MSTARRLLAAPILLLGAAALPAADYTIDSKHTRPTFEIGHFGYSTFRGRFDRTTGSLSYDAAARTGKANVSIEVASVSTGVPDIDTHLRAAEFFDATKFPAITFESTAFVFADDELQSVQGNLTIKGVTRPVTLEVLEVTCKPHPLRKTPTCGADLEVSINRSQFGVSAYLPLVADEVLLRIGVEASASAP